jgi:hypothetical protein
MTTRVGSLVAPGRVEFEVWGLEALTLEQACEGLKDLRAAPRPKAQLAPSASVQGASSKTRASATAGQTALLR